MGGSYAPGVTDRIKFVYDRTKLDLYWHFDSTSEKVIESPVGMRLEMLVFRLVVLVSFKFDYIK